MFGLDQWLHIISLVTPIVSIFVPGAAPLAPYILAGIQEAAQLHDASGADKKAHALKVVENGIAVTNKLKPGAVNPTTGLAAASSAIETVLLVAKTVHQSNTPDSTVEILDKPASPPTVKP